MKFREHPLMSYRGMRNWPPVWIQRDPAGKLRGKKFRGEIGVLKRVLHHLDMPNECFLLIEHRGESWMGALLFDDRPFCAQIAGFLKLHVGHSIKEIGGIDLAFTL